MMEKFYYLKRKDNVPYGGLWGFTGGGAEKDETPKEAAVSEKPLEETGTQSFT
jgi:ADP-ribose pyrophosphatase YjhB (NUDIX family)